MKQYRFFKILSQNKNLVAQNLFRLITHCSTLFLQAIELRSNAAGLSRQNRLKAHSLVKLLQIYHSHFSSSYEFISSLPIAGQDGTLKNRMKSAKGQVRAKSGQLDGVIGLAGYVQTQNQGIKAFAVIYNGKKTNHKVIQFIDQLILSLYSL